MEKARRSTLELQFRQDDKGVAGKASVLRRAFDVEHVSTQGGSDYDFHWDGSRAYLCWHDIVLADGEMQGDDFAPVRQRDLRRRMTFFPTAMKVEGWAEQTERRNSYTVLYFDEAWLFEQLETPDAQRSLRPMIYLNDPALAVSMERLSEVARDRNGAPRIVIDSAALLAGAELLRVQGAVREHAGSLPKDRLQTTKDYIEAHINEDIALADIAKAAA